MQPLLVPTIPVSFAWTPHLASRTTLLLLEQLPPCHHIFFLAKVARTLESLYLGPDVMTWWGAEKGGCLPAIPKGSSAGCLYSQKGKGTCACNNQDSPFMSAPIVVQFIMEMKGCVCTDHKSFVRLKCPPSDLGGSGSWFSVEQKSATSCWLAKPSAGVMLWGLP
jgi:hypothetical protein